ncbi:MAG: glycosyltransferase family 4 protein [Crenarchaeota archaeon]|nr:glycosyltransferase family 4 protein [Thermoproteota archaeon]
MKIALCSDYFYPKTGGITTHAENLARTLKNRGHEVTIITKTADFNDETHGLNVLRIKSLFRSSQTLDIPNIDELEKALRENRPDIIHAHHAFSPISLFSLLVGKRLGIKTVLTNHSIQFLYDFNYLWKPSSFMLFPFKQYINNADRIIAVSRAAAIFISHFTDKEVAIIPNGVKVEEFVPQTKKFDGKSVLFVGRLVYRKGLHLLLEAIKQVVDEKRDVELTIAGSGYLSPILRAAVKTTGLQDNVFLREGLGKSELVNLYQRANVFVLPSIFGESFGIVLLEAMASKTPIVATAQGGVREIVKHMETGLLARKNRTEDLAKGILTLLEDKELSERISSNAFREVRKYDWDIIVEKIEEVYEEVLH